MRVEFWVYPTFSLAVLGSLTDAFACESIGGQTYRGVTLLLANRSEVRLYLDWGKQERSAQAAARTCDKIYTYGTGTYCLREDVKRALNISPGENDFVVYSSDNTPANKFYRFR
jgi:hypothetical protein